MQLDIFEDGRAEMLRNDVVLPLSRRDCAAAAAAWERLAQAYPRDEYLADLRVLMVALAPAGAAPFASHEALGSACRQLDEVTAPAAGRVFGAGEAGRWLAPLWQDLARRSARLPFQAGWPHAAALWLRAGDFGAAVQAVETIPSWRRIPLPLAWMAQAQLHTHGLQSTWPLLAELAWLSPGLLAHVAALSPHPALPRWLQQFEEEFESGDDLAWWPAWLLTQHSPLAPQLALAQPARHESPEQAMRLLVELLGLERQGRHHDLVLQRKELRDLNPELYAAYIRRR